LQAPRTPPGMGEASAHKPAKNWLRLLIESVDVPLDHKDPHRLHFSTVQSLVPGAHGLYYRGADGARKALAFDGAGHVAAPEEGWDNQSIFIHLAHGHRAGAFGCGGVMRGAASVGDLSETSSSSPVDAYTTATDRFEKTVSLVQQMMKASTIGLRPSRKSKVSQSIDSSEEETISKKYKEENDGLRKKVVELEAELSSTQESLEEARDQETHEKNILRESAACAEARLDEAERMAESATRRACEADHAHNSERQRADKAEWSLGEHRTWLGESKTRVAQLEGQLEESHRELTEQRARAEKAEWTLGEHVAWLETAKKRSADLERALSDARDQVAELRDRTERAEWSLDEQSLWLQEEREKTRAITAAAECATTELREKVASIESELCTRVPSIILPEHIVDASDDVIVECDTTVASSRQSENSEEEKESVTEEEMSVITVTHQQSASPFTRSDTVEALEERVRELESELEASRRAIQTEFEAQLADVSQKAAQSVAELAAAKIRLEEENAMEVNTKIQELTEKEDELNNLHTVIEDLRQKLKDLERARSDAEWHLGEHRDWLKNERDKVSYLEEQLRRVSSGEHATSRPVSRKNSTESGFGGSTAAGKDDSEGERRGSESPPVPRKMKITSGADDLAAELMALSKDKQRMAQEIRELKSRPDPALLDAERRAMAEQVHAVNERAARLEAETAHYKDVAARVNLDAFHARDQRIAELEKIRADLEWAMGEKKQEINDAKWRMGELEGKLEQLQKTPHANESTTHELQQLRDEKAHLVQQLDNARWRLGELEAEVGRLHESAAGDQLQLQRLQKLQHDSKWRIGELESGYAHHEWLLSQRPGRDELNALQAEKSSLEQRLGEASKAADDAKWRLGEVEAELAHSRSLQQQQPAAAANTAELQQLQQQRDSLQQAWHDQQWRIGELESGYAHHEHVIDGLQKRLRAEDGSNMLEHELQWKLGEAGKECDTLRGRISHLEHELGKREAAAAAERPGQLEECLRELRAEKEQLEGRARQLDQMYNDTKWRNGELEAGLAHTKWLLDEERNKVARIADCNAEATRDGSFVVRHRRPGDARLWQLAMKTSADDTSELRAVTLSIDEKSNTDAVFVIGSFSTWECCARLSRPDQSSARRELTLHLPKGRHEFRFIIEGGWHNSTAYPTVPNPFGTMNNWISVE
ncbi:hypothetical protein PFISCL1PPCAC_22812, partial [Pristionchus fissidentatus]